MIRPPCKNCAGTEAHRDGRCAACARKKALSYRNKDPEASRIAERAWRAIHKDRLNQNRTDLKKSNPEYYRELNRKCKYKLAAGAFAAILSSQGSCCAICKTETPGGQGSFHVDHNHECCPGHKSCGSCVRGILCNRCNLLVGHANDSVPILLSAATYISSWNK
jgi:hypothetical protein